MRLFTLIVVLSASLPACETVVEVSPPSHEPQLVASGFFSTDSLWLVDVSRSVTYTSDERPTAVVDAAVEIREADRVVQTLNPSVSGIYAGSGFVPQPGKRYTLRVSAPGYEDVEGSDRLPDAPEVASFRATSRKDEGDVVLDLEVELKDPGSDKNYYGIFVIQERLRIDVRTGRTEALEPSLFTFESEDRAFDDGLPDYLNTGIGRHRRPLFTDEVFDGGSRPIQLRVRFNTSDSASDVQVLRAFTVVVLSLSENLYTYRTSVDRQDFSDENPFAEPVRIHSNMKNGFGVFGGYRIRAFRVPGPVWNAMCEPPGAWTGACDAPGERAGAASSKLVRAFFARSDYASLVVDGSH